MVCASQQSSQEPKWGPKMRGVNSTRATRRRVADRNTTRPNTKANLVDLAIFKRTTVDKEAHNVTPLRTPGTNHPIMPRHGQPSVSLSCPPRSNPDPADNPASRHQKYLPMLSSPTLTSHPSSAIPKRTSVLSSPSHLPHRRRPARTRTRQNHPRAGKPSSMWLAAR